MKSKYKCSCPVGSPFHWWEGTTSFSRELTLGVKSSIGSTRSVEKARKKGIEPGRIYGMSDKSDAQIIAWGNLERILIKR